MVHILSRVRRGEFLSGNCIARFEMCISDGEGVPTLYVKSSMIDIYFLTKSKCLSLDFVEIDVDLVAYVLGVDEGENYPLYLYSVIETLSEKRALEVVASGVNFDVIVFNDFAIEIARSTGKYTGNDLDIGKIRALVPLGADCLGQNADRVADAVSSCVYSPWFNRNICISLSGFESNVTSRVFSFRGNVMAINGFNEATVVHEMLPQIVEDHTSLRFVHSPEVEISDGNFRELSDAIIFGGAALLSIQAKCFNFSGDIPPTRRSNAEKRMRKNVRKAIAQTRGSSRMLRERKVVRSRGEVIDVPKEMSLLFAIFIPSLDLISEDVDKELLELGEELNDHGQNLVVVDPMQFLRTVQAAEGVFDKMKCTPDEAFFYLLSENSDHARRRREYRSPILYRW